MKNRNYYEERFEKSIKIVEELTDELRLDDADCNAYEDQRDEFEEIVLELIHKYAKD